jgi:tetratricopeptide (TPR) repeat protein
LGAGGFLSGLNDLADADPWTLYFDAMRLADKGDAAANDLAIEFFRKIIADDPGFARAHIGLAQCFANYVNYQGRKEVLWLDKSEEILAKAQSLEPDLPEAYAVRIKNLMMREFLLNSDTSRDYFRLASEALTRYPYDGRLCGIIGLCHLKRFDRKGDQADFEEALRLLRISFNADPAALMNMTLVELLLFKGEFGQALGVCSEVEREHPLAIIALRRGEVLYYQGDMVGSLAALRSCTAPLSLRVEALQYEAMIAARRGDRNRAFAVLGEIEVLIPRKEAVYLDHLREASVYAGLGDTARAEALLGEGLAGLAVSGSYVLRSYIEIDPNFKDMRRSLVLPRARLAAMSR